MRFLIVALSLALCAHAFVPRVQVADPFGKQHRLVKRTAGAQAKKLGLQSGTACITLNPTCQSTGGPCTEDLTLLNPWNVCNEGLGCANATATCQPASTLGSACTDDLDCTDAGGLTIEGALLELVCWSGQCADKKLILPPTGCRSVGDECTANGECVNNNCTNGVCLGKPTNGSCVFGNTGAECAQGHYCYAPDLILGNSTGWCTPYIANGQSSWFINVSVDTQFFLGTLSCLSGYYNQSDSPTFPCLPFPQLFAKGVGQRCDYHLDDGSLLGSDQASGIVSECNQGLYCNSTSSTCRPLQTEDGVDVMEGGQCNMTNGNPNDNDCPQPVKTRQDEWPNTAMTCMCSTRTAGSATCKYQNDDEFYRSIYGTFFAGGSSRCQTSTRDEIGNCAVPVAYSNQGWESSQDWEGSCKYKGTLCAKANYIANVFNNLLGSLKDSYLPAGTTEVCGQPINTLSGASYCSSAASVSAFGALVSALAMGLWALLN